MRRPRSFTIQTILALLLLALVLIATVLLRTLLVSSPKRGEVPATTETRFDMKLAAEHLAEAIRFQTVSYDSEATLDTAVYKGLRDQLARSFPRVHSVLTREVIGGASLVYTWTGTDPALPAILFSAHLDVVAADPNSPVSWKRPPFSGDISDGFIWGRGALDDKSSVVGILEAVEALLNMEFKPRRTIYLAFGHDEEIDGKNGAAQISALLAARGVRLEFVLDEGTGVMHDIVPSALKPVALIGIAEKGYLSLRLTVRTTGGHSSMPPPTETAIEILAKAVVRLDDHPLPIQLRTPVSEMLEHLAPEMPFAQRMAFANLWLFGPLVRSALQEAPATNAIVRTTMATTVIQGGTKDNVLPTEASAIINFRILPGDSIDSVSAHVREVLGNPAISIEPLPGQSNPSPVSDIKAAGFKALETAVLQIFPDAVVVPGLSVATTDSKHYAAIAANTYRFLPVRINVEDLDRFHGSNERLGFEAYEELIRFYMQFILNAASLAAH